MDEVEGRRLFQQLIDGLSYCHDKGVYHRDLKVFTSSFCLISLNNPLFIAFLFDISCRLIRVVGKRAC